MNTTVLASFYRAVRSLWADTDGVILPYVTLMLVVLVGAGVLALDGGRYASLQSQLQKGADALAIAGAAELDRLPNSTTRAVNAVNNLITNSSVFGTGGVANVTVSAVNFRTTLPASDNSPLGAPLCSGGGCTPDQAVLARFIEVVVTPTTIPTILPAAFFGGPSTVTANASAVAGMDQTVCKMVPMFVCNPYENPDGSMSYADATQALLSAMASPAMRRRQIAMRQGGQGGGDNQYSPGNYGFLDSPSLGSGANALRDAIAMVSSLACFRQNGVDTKPGFTASVRAAVNVRFDIYEGPLNSSKNDPNFRPAMNVRKGFSYTGNACNAAPDADTARFRGLPDDTCFASTCPHMGGRMGDGTWDFDAYWPVNHTLGGSLQTKPIGGDGTNPASNTNLPSRYDVYRYEVTQGTSFINNPSGQAATPPPGNPELGAPSCSGSATNDVPDRRIFHAAIVNCKATLPPSLPLGPGNQSGIPVAAFAKFFFTRPVSAAQDEIMAEIVEAVTPGSSAGVNFDQVQLYR